MNMVIEGEVVETRDLDLLPPSKDEKLAALSRLTPEQQVDTVTGMLVQANVGLLVAIAAQDLPGIVEAKQKASTIQEITKQLRMGKEMSLHAAEFVRRAERGLGVAIREGQARNEVLRPGQKNGHSGGHDRHTLTPPVNGEVKPSPTDFATPSELSGANKPGEGIYAMTDGVSDEQFEEAIAEARDEGNLSRANVARKAKAKAQKKEPIDADDPLIDAEVESDPKPAAPPKKRLTKHDSTEMLANINGMLNGIVETLPFINPTEVDPTDADNKRVIENMRQSMARIRRLLKEIEHG